MASCGVSLWQDNSVGSVWCSAGVKNWYLVAQSKPDCRIFLEVYSAWIVMHRLRAGNIRIAVRGCRLLITVLGSEKCYLRYTTKWSTDNKCEIYNHSDRRIHILYSRCSRTTAKAWYWNKPGLEWPNTAGVVSDQVRVPWLVRLERGDHQVCVAWLLHLLQHHWKDWWGRK